MTQPRFFRFHSPSSQKLLAEWHEEMDLEQVLCPENPGHQRGGQRTTPLSVVLPRPPLADFVWTWLSECLLRDRALRLLEGSGFTGFTTRRARAVYRNSAEAAPPLRELLVTGWGGLAPQASGIRLVGSCEACGMLFYSGFTRPDLLVDLEGWDGSDLFIVWPLPRYLLVTERVRDAIRQAGLTGCRFQPLEELEPTDGLSPGRLHYWMPAERARLLGEPLGIH